MWALVSESKWVCLLRHPWRSLSGTSTEGTGEKRDMSIGGSLKWMHRHFSWKKGLHLLEMHIVWWTVVEGGQIATGSAVLRDETEIQKWHQNRMSTMDITEWETLGSWWPTNTEFKSNLCPPTSTAEQIWCFKGFRCPLASPTRSIWTSTHSHYYKKKHWVTVVGDSVSVTETSSTTWSRVTKGNAAYQSLRSMMLPRG